MFISMKDHQMDALSRLKNGNILCGGVGSGKSRVSIAWYYINQGGDLNGDSDGKYVKMKNPKDLYIITTARKRDDMEWDSELSVFLIARDKDISIYNHNVVIDSWNNIQKYANIKNSVFIFDEQRVVGSGVWVESFLKITKNNEWILLSATPGDTWMEYVPVFIANGFFKNRTQFVNEHVVYRPFVKFRQVDRYVNVTRLIRLRDRILVDMDFNRETIPHHEDVRVDYDKRLYISTVNTRWNPYTDEPIRNVSEYCQCLRRIVNEDRSRQLKLLEIVSTHPRVIVFYNYDYELMILRNLYYGDDVVVSEWNGHKHQPIPDTKRWVYLVQYTAGAEGWNCIKTDTIVFYSQHYSYKILTQSAGRIDRMNTTYRDLWYYHLKSTAPIDRAISLAIKKKKKFNESKFCPSLDDPFELKYAS